MVGTSAAGAEGVICGEGEAGLGIFIVAHNTCCVGAGGFLINASAGSVRIKKTNTENIRHPNSNKRRETRVKDFLFILI
jgi:hypothetical protein